MKGDILMKKRVIVLFVAIIMIMFFITILSSCQGFDNFKKTTFEKEIDIINENLINKYNVTI